MFPANIIGEELENCKQVQEFEQKLNQLKEMMLKHDETFGQILENLNLNQTSIDALKQFMTEQTRSL